MKTIDLNADMGEAEDADGIASELAILKYVSSASIACGGHRGDADSMARVSREALDRGVRIGAHPAYPDRENFGRTSFVLGKDISEEDLRAELKTQINALKDIVAQQGTRLGYVKPHGALYNDAVKSADLSTLIVDVISGIDPALAFMGAPNSEMGKAATQRGLKFIAEGFIDRRYRRDGHLQSRSIDGAVIKTHAERMAQLHGLITTGEVETAGQNIIKLACDSLCLHSDSAGALETAASARDLIEAAGVLVCAAPRPANNNAAI
jgi:UPF0271 protein